jgi:hypothetical protein
MPVPDEEMARLCRSVLGEPLDPNTRAPMASQLEDVAATNRALVLRLTLQAEPEGHAALFRRIRRDG